MLKVLMNRARGQSWRAGWAVRRDWPDATHELVGFRVRMPAAARFVDRDRAFWCRGPMRPTSWALVVVSRRDFDLHAGRRYCRAPDCAAPTASVRHREQLRR